jgi:hypothetical protein
VSIDVIERRRVVEERLRRARDLARALDQATGDIADSSGQGIEKIDPDGTLRTAVTTLAGVAALRPGFDVLVSLPDSVLALRVRHESADVDITLVRLDGERPPHEAAETAPPAETAPAATIPTQPGEPEPTEPEGHVVSDLAAMLWQDIGPPA